jgi:hypothetical protein
MAPEVRDRNVRIEGWEADVYGLGILISDMIDGNEKCKGIRVPWL